MSEDQDITQAAEPAKRTFQDLLDEENAKREAVAAEHAAMWAGLDGADPFQWPDDARNLYQRGCQCSLWGRSTVDMTPAQLILFVAYIDTIASDLHNQCKGLSMAIEQHNEVARAVDAAEQEAGDAQ